MESRPLPAILPGPYSGPDVMARFLAVAASQIGYREGRAKDGDWNNDNAYGVWFGLNYVSWCAQFVSWCADRAGILGVVIPRHQYTPSGWTWFSSRGLDVPSPQPGDIFYVYGRVPSEGISRVHHVGIVEKVLDGNRIQTIEGNTNTTGSSQGNGVYRLNRSITSSLRFARPKYAAAAKVPDNPIYASTLTKVVAWEMNTSGISAPDQWERGHAERVKSTLDWETVQYGGKVPTEPGFRRHLLAYQAAHKLKDQRGLITAETIDMLCRENTYVRWDGHPRTPSALLPKDR